jgi:hypothetical protein
MCVVDCARPVWYGLHALWPPRGPLSDNPCLRAPLPTCALPVSEAGTANSGQQSPGLLRRLQAMLNRGDSPRRSPPALRSVDHAGAPGGASAGVESGYPGMEPEGPVGLYQDLAPVEEGSAETGGDLDSPRGQGDRGADRYVCNTCCRVIDGPFRGPSLNHPSAAP